MSDLDAAAEKARAELNEWITRFRVCVSCDVRWWGDAECWVCGQEAPSDDRRHVPWNAMRWRWEDDGGAIVR